jgi:hypothetical protein
MRLIGVAVVLALSLAFAPLVGEAQQAARLYQVGYLTLGSQPTQSGLWRSFLDAMRELNYEEGRNLVVRHRGGRRRVPGGLALRRGLRGCRRRLLRQPPHRLRRGGNSALGNSTNCPGPRLESNRGRLEPTDCQADGL